MTLRPPAIICDIDGTLAHHGPAGREFNDYTKVGEDVPNDPVLWLLRCVALWGGTRIVLVSGRENIGYCRSLTELWLKSYEVPYHALFMRGPKDHRRDDLVKWEIYHAHIQGVYDIRFVLEDRNRLVTMWRGLGLTCLQVAEGDF